MHMGTGRGGGGEALDQPTLRVTMPTLPTPGDILRSLHPCEPSFLQQQNQDRRLDIPICLSQEVKVNLTKVNVTNINKVSGELSHVGCEYSNSTSPQGPSHPNP